MNSLNREQLAALVQEYQHTLPEKIAALEEFWERHWQTPDDKHPLESIHRACHGLAGSAGSFGYDRLSDLAREMELLVESVLADTRKKAEIPAQTVRTLLTAIRQAAEQTPQPISELAF